MPLKKGKISLLKLSNMGFFKSLLSADGGISSKRFAGLCLIGTYIGVVIYGVISGNLPAEIESSIKVGLYTGAMLLGVSVAPDMIKAVQRPTPVVIETKKENEDK